MANRILEYFDLGSRIRARGAVAMPAAPDQQSQPRALDWWSQWIALLAGIIVEPFFNGYRATGALAMPSFDAWIVFAVIVSIVALPAVYRDGLDERPYFIQLCSVFTLGLGWQAIVASVTS